MTHDYLALDKIEVHKSLTLILSQLRKYSTTEECDLEYRIVKKGIQFMLEDLDLYTDVDKLEKDYAALLKDGISYEDKWLYNIS